MIEHIQITQPVLQYMREYSLRDSDILNALRTETGMLPERNQQILAEQGQFINFIIKLISAKKTLEVGVFTGYSALCTVLALPEDGRLTACDCSEEWLAIARKYWKRAEVDSRINVVVGEALDSLKNLLTEEGPESYDFVFIDADKVNYDNYYEYTLKLTRPGGLIMVDNTLWSGKVADMGISDPDIDALRALNLKLLNDERVDISMIPFADGITLIRKR